MSGAIVITGGANGIGLAIATRLADMDHPIIIADRDGAAAQTAATKIGAEALEMDVTDETSVVTGMRQIADQHGLRSVINSAGIHKNVSVLATEMEDWDRIHSVNARGTFLVCREAARHMVKARDGHIINIITRVNFGNPFSTAYMASKSAAHAVTQCLAVEVAKAGVRVNAVAPGHVGPGTNMVQHFEAKAKSLGLSWDEFESQVHKSIPLGRWCKPDDVAGAVNFLLGPDAQFITGEVIYVTGGFQAYGVSPDPDQLENPYDT